LNLFAETGDILLIQPKKDVTEEVCLLLKFFDNIDNKEKIFVLNVGKSINKGIYLRSWDDFRV